MKYYRPNLYLPSAQRNRPYCVRGEQAVNNSTIVLLINPTNLALFISFLIILFLIIQVWVCTTAQN